VLRQRASIAVAFVRPFRLLLVDEPFVGLDAAARAALLELIDGVVAGGASAIVATHQLDHAASCPRVIALRDGAVIHDRPAALDELAALVDA
jgi:ABC-type multidrug transport system ATPase subunit